MADSDENHSKTPAGLGFASAPAEPPPSGEDQSAANTAGTVSHPAAEAFEGLAGEGDARPEVLPPPSGEDQSAPNAAGNVSPPEVEAFEGQTDEGGARTEVSPPHISSEEPVSQDRLDTVASEERVAAAQAPDPMAHEPARPHAKPRTPFAALTATAIIGGLLGFGGSAALRHFESVQPGNFVTEEQIAALTVRLDSLEGKANTADSAQTALSALEARVAAAESAANKAAELANTVEADLQKQLASKPATQAAGSSSPTAEAPDLAPFTARMDTIEQKLSSLESSLTAPKTELRAHQQEPDNLAAKQATIAQSIAVVAQSLLHDLENDKPITEEITALENLGVQADSLAPLHAVAALPVSSIKQLTKEFSALAAKIIAADPANQPAADETFLDRVTRHAKGLVHVHRVGEGESVDTETLVERIEKALADHDFEAAYKAWTDLPDPGKKISANWGEAMKARLDAIEAARMIETDSVAALGKPKT